MLICIAVYGVGVYDREDPNLCSVEENEGQISCGVHLHQNFRNMRLQ